MNEIFHGDCISHMHDWGSCSIDFTFLDPPYNVGKKYDGYNDDLHPDAYHEWMDDVLYDVRRISRKGFAVLVGSNLLREYAYLIPDAKPIIIHKRAVGIIDRGYFLQWNVLFVVGEPLRKVKDLWDDIRLPGEGYYYRDKRYDHPGETPVKLIKRVIINWTEAGDLIYDPFMGIGSTAIAAIQTDRNFLGSEQSQLYVDMANQRIADELRQIRMPV